MDTGLGLEGASVEGLLKGPSSSSEDSTILGAGSRAFLLMEPKGKARGEREGRQAGWEEGLQEGGQLCTLIQPCMGENRVVD